MSTLTAILFDLGDTLVDLGEGRGDYEAHVRVRAGRVYDALTAAGVTLEERDAFCVILAHESEAAYRGATARQEGIDIYDVLAAFFAERGQPLTDELVRIAGDAYCRRSGDHAPLRPGAIETLTALRARGLRLGVISNTIQPARHMDDGLVLRGLAEYFPVRIYSSAARFAKPHPAIFHAALDALGVEPEAAAYVGDRLHADVAGAQGVGMKGILIEVAHRVEHDPAIKPDARIEELPDLLAILPGWLE
jgi:putative hydrolase of the HAD superfamily